MSEEAAYALLFPGRGDAGPVHADPDWARVHRELARTGVTLKLLHAEYADECAEAGAVHVLRQDLQAINNAPPPGRQGRGQHAVASRIDR